MRFTLRGLFIVVTLAAVLCAVLFALPSGISLIVLGLSTLSITPACIAGVVYGRGKIRAFAIGCLTTGWWISFATFYYGIVVMFEGDWKELLSLADSANEGTIVYKFGWAVLMAWVGFSGLVSVGVRWLVRPRTIREKPVVLSARVLAETSAEEQPVETATAASGA